MNNIHTTNISRRNVLKSLTGAVVGTLLVGGGLSSSISASTVYLEDGVLLPEQLHMLFNIQSCKQDATACLIYNLKHSIEKMPGDQIPTIAMVLEKTGIDCNNLVKGNVLKDVKLFMDYAFENIQLEKDKVHNAADLILHANRIAVMSRRGSGNIALIHPSHKNSATINHTKNRILFVYTDDMPRDRIILWYNGKQFYDGAVTIVHRENDINNHLLVCNDVLPNYCKILSI
jgi:hypothetical protein